MSVRRVSWLRGGGSSGADAVWLSLRKASRVDVWRSAFVVLASVCIALAKIRAWCFWMEVLSGVPASSLSGPARVEDRFIGREKIQRRLTFVVFKEREAVVLVSLG